MFPLPMHPKAADKAKAVVCSKSSKVMDDVMEGKEPPKAECDSKEVENNLALGAKLGVNGTPTMIMPDGGIIPSFMQSEELIKTIDAAVEAAKAKKEVEADSKADAKDAKEKEQKTEK